MIITTIKETEVINLKEQGLGTREVLEERKGNRNWSNYFIISKISKFLKNKLQFKLCM